MINTAIIAFTQKGMALANRISETWSSNVPCEIYAKYEGFLPEHCPKADKVEGSLIEWTLEMQRRQCGLVFIGAMGIAVRAIAAGLESKLTDAPVIVIDELGQHVIPVVAGHVGGANEFAINLAFNIGATPVITTATDLNGAFSVDLFAMENELTISNKDGIARVSSKALEDKPIRLSIQDYPPDNAEIIVSRDKRMKASCDILLCPKTYGVGIGCRKHTSFEELRDFLLEQLEECGIKLEDVGAIASIDLKLNEAGLVELCRFYRIPFITYSADLLKKAAGDYEESTFVLEQTGVGNVCERSAMLLTGNRGQIVSHKVASNGMTIAIAKIG